MVLGVSVLKAWGGPHRTAGSHARRRIVSSTEGPNVTAVSFRLCWWRVRREDGEQSLEVGGGWQRRDTREIGPIKTRMSAVPPTWVAHVQRSGDSIGWAGIIPSDPKYGCIDPPPFGKQCTLPRAAAIAACMAMQHCIAVTCPDPTESHIGTRGITGPVCQLRSERTPNERGHGMCKPSGCVNIALSRIRRPNSLHDWRSLGGPSTPLRNPSLLFLHGDLAEHKILLPQGVGRYWPLEQGGADGEAAPPNTGLLFVVDAVPNSTALSARYPRPDLWKMERGRAGGGGRRGRGKRG